MDFWSRLLSPLSSGSTRKDLAKDPAKRLNRFEKEYRLLLSAWRNTSNISRDGEAAEALEVQLQQLTNILSDESRRPLPHPCIQYASINQIYIPIGKIATTSNDEWIIKEAVLFFATLVESEEEAFVENATFSASMTNLLVRITGQNSVRLGLDTESRVVELAFNITTKIRLDPKVLPAWFKAQAQQHGHRHDDRDRDSHERFAGRTQKADFPLFYILMDYIHHEGKVGDFARTGLLYIIEAASNSASLEQWIVESDLSTLMATGLGALYSQLSRKLVIDHLPHCLPPILAFSDYEHPKSDYEIISSCSPGFQSHLETFLSHLLFWQDVLNHCRSVEVKSTLLEHFQVIFLQQVLYPSLLESSDIDGGSSVAVLTYLRRILESLDHPDMINLILHYLLALPDSFPSEEGSSSVSAARKRKSMDLATMLAQKTEAAAATPLLFNLVDLILACLRSRNQQTIHVTLQLVSAILKRHHRYAVITLLKTDVLPSSNVHRTIGAQEQEIEYIMYLAESIGGQSNFDDVYETVLQDTLTRLETHPCSTKLVAPKTSLGNQRLPDSLPGAPKDVSEHTLRPDDPLLNSLLDLMETFFLNAVETNLSVTEALVDLAICGYMRVEGWLTRDPNAYVYEEEAEEDGANEGPSNQADPEDDPREAELQRLKAMHRCQRRPKWNSASIPRVLAVVKRLEEQVLAYKRTVPRFDELVQQRREAFQTADAMLHLSFASYRPTPAPQDTPDRPSYEDVSRSGSPSRPSALEGLAQRLLSELGTPSRSNSPRGRKEQARSSGSAISTPGLKAAPIIYSEPQSFSPASGQDRASSYGIRDDAVASQMAAFAAVDQTILSRRVGLPEDKVEPIPLKLDKDTEEAGAEAERSEIEKAGNEAKMESKEDAKEEKTDGIDDGDSEKEDGADAEEKIDGYKAEGEGSATGEQGGGEGHPNKIENEPDNNDEGKSNENGEAEPNDKAGQETNGDIDGQADGNDQETPDGDGEARDGDDGADSQAQEENADTTQTIEITSPDEPEEPITVSVSHVITNVIVLQSFLLELAGLIQVRAGLFDEVRFV